MKTRRKIRPDIIVCKNLGLDWTVDQRDAFIKSIKVIDLPRLSEPYPINNFYVAGTEKAKEEWDAYWYEKPLKDPRYHRGVRREVLTLDKSRLRYIVRQDESVIFRDADTKELSLVILRNFIPDEDLRETMVELCKEIIKNRRDDRREDPGMLVHFGYTCGSRHDPQIQLAASSLRLNTEAKRRNEEQLNHRAQGMAGVMWNLMRSRLPSEIIDDYNDTILENDFPRMDMGREDNTFTFQVGGDDITFKGLELPPPSGISAINYARHTHKETNGNNWVLACTCHAPKDPTKGGNFYLASYGIMMEPASNTVSAWHPKDYHGTTLYEMKEGKERRAGYEVRQDGDFNTGMVLELSKSLKNARKNSAWLDNRRGTKKLEHILKKTKRISSQTRYLLRPRTCARV
ncbi:hypothetical protein F5X96DRAFT_684239 [Biscogniauxia mediterranea]|nr:hypothetical protein F5X96DRAFT_684239 [Biscogniauxia mediterranea]